MKKVPRQFKSHKCCEVEHGSLKAVVEGFLSFFLSFLRDFFEMRGPGRLLSLSF